MIYDLDSARLGQWHLLPGRTLCIRLRRGGCLRVQRRLHTLNSIVVTPLDLHASSVSDARRHAILLCIAPVLSDGPYLLMTSTHEFQKKKHDHCDWWFQLNISGQPFLLVYDYVGCTTGISVATFLLLWVCYTIIVIGDAQRTSFCSPRGVRSAVSVLFISENCQN